MTHNTGVYYGTDLARYGFGDDHPFGPDRLDAFWNRFKTEAAYQQISVRDPLAASAEQLLRFHDPDYVETVRQRSKLGTGFLDQGDTPAFIGIYEAASYVVGSLLDALEAVMSEELDNAFVPIAGLHHARRDSASGFCAFNDCGVAIETLKQHYGLQRIAYIDIDAHHGDGVFYAFESDPALIFADTHQDGRTLYPGTGAITETGKGDAMGTKLNIPLPPGADDQAFMKLWPAIEKFIDRHEPQFILLQAGADSLHGDPITQLSLSEKSHCHAAQRLQLLADRHCQGRLVAMGGGGYNRDNLARAWCAVVEAMLNQQEAEG